MSCLQWLVFYAEKRDAERDIMPVWLIHCLVQSLTGGSAVTLEELLAEVERDGGTPEAKKERTAEEILAGALPFIEADKRRRAT